MMLPINNRLKERRDFGKVYENGKFFSSSGLTVRFARNGLEVSRVGFSIGKNFSKKAVERNRVRRLLRESSRLALPRLKTGFDIVISYGSKIKNPSLSELSKQLDSLLAKSGLFT